MRRLAADRGQSLSATASSLMALGLEALGEPSRVTINSLTGLPNIDLGRAFTQAEIDALMDEDQ